MTKKFRFDKTVAARLEESRLHARHRAVFGHWLNQFAWAHFITLTFADICYRTEAIRRFKNYRTGLARLTCNRVPCFRVIETGSRGKIHIHALLQATEHVTEEAIAARWKHGRSLVVRYDSTRGATHYVSKDLLLETADWEFEDFKHLKGVLNASR